MRNVIVLLGALALVACEKDKVPDKVGGTTTTTGATPVTVEDVRVVLLEHRPAAKDAINSVIITNDQGIITLRGRVDDEATHADIVNTVRGMPNVKGVNDQLQVSPKMGADPGKIGSDQQGKMGTDPGKMGTDPGKMGTDPGKMGTDPGKVGTDPSQLQQHPGATQTNRTAAVKLTMSKDRPAAAAVIEKLVITDDGSVIYLAGIVPDEAMHQALVKSAQKTAGVKKVQDELKVKGN